MMKKEAKNGHKNKKRKERHKYYNSYKELHNRRRFKTNVLWGTYI
jgi:hypothetical protein